jgi:hypothetical protein
VDEDWAVKWEQVFDQAQAAGIDIMLVFSGWYDWNTHGYSNWANNPLNSANGGLAQSAHDLFQKDSKTQTLWLSWLKTLVNRWQSRQNIAIWEIYSEVNLTDNVTEAEGIYFINQAASIIHSVDPKHRPITASLADFGQWNQFYSASSIDLINIHPYPTSGQLDLKIIHDVPLLQAQYHKPVMIGESGLSAETPDSNPPTLTTARNAPLGIQHAIWAGVVSGSMNARSLYWEDSYAIYFPTLTYLLDQYKDTELAAAHFIQGVDFSGFTPLAVSTESTITGAAVGSPQTIIGWFRDATCEPPDWNMQPVVSKQTVMITIPGPAANWRAYFYDTATGIDLIGSTTVVQNGGRITIPLPDFKDAIAFKLNFQSAAEPAVSPTGEPTLETPGPISTDLIAGKWTGTIFSSTSGFTTRIDLSIQADCQVNQVCGTVSTPQLCSGNLVLTAIDASTYIFIEQDMTGISSCASGGSESLQLLADGSLSFNFKSSPTQGGVISSSGTLKRP